MSLEQPMNRLLQTFLLLLTLLSARASADAPPNILIFFVDDMGWADWQRDPRYNPTGGLLYETPHMLELARKGVTFRNAYAASPVCTPTRSALATGMTPARNGMTQLTDKVKNHRTKTMRDTEADGSVRWVENLPLGNTLGEVMREAGYATGFFGKWHLGEEGNPSGDPLRAGYQVNIAGCRKGAPQLNGFFAGKDGAWVGMPGLDPEDLGKDNRFAPDAYLTDVTTDFVERFITRNHAGGKPFFALVSHYDVHTPNQAPRPGMAGHEELVRFQEKKARIAKEGHKLQGHGNAAYAWKLFKMDQSLGRLLARLDDPDGDGDSSDSIRDRTLVIFASDNGGQLGITSNYPLRSGKGVLYEGGIRTPLIVSWTGRRDIPQGAVSEALTSTEDLYTTATHAASAPLARGIARRLDGVSLLPVLAGKGSGREALVWHYPHLCNGRPDGLHFGSAIRSGKWKLVWFYDTGKYELYDLEADLAETINRLEAEPAVAARLSRQLHDYLVSVKAKYPIRFGEGEEKEVGPPPVLE